MHWVWIFYSAVVRFFGQINKKLVCKIKSKIYRKKYIESEPYDIQLCVLCFLLRLMYFSRDTHIQYGGSMRDYAMAAAEADEDRESGETPPPPPIPPPTPPDSPKVTAFLFMLQYYILC